MYINMYMTRESDENCILQNMTHIDLCTWCASVNNLFCFSGNEHTVYACIWLGHKRIKINILSFLSCGVCYFMGGGLFKISFGCFFSFLFVCLFVCLSFMRVFFAEMGVWFAIFYTFIKKSMLYWTTKAL